MPRRPRADAAATSRISIRVTEREAADLEALARRLGVSAADLVRGWIGRERAAINYVDAKPGPDPSEVSPRSRYPRHVFTLHPVPGGREPLCVRRRVLKCDAHLEFEYARGKRVAVNFDKLLEEGAQPTYGHGSIDDDDAMVEYTSGHIVYPMEPRIWVYPDVPSDEERRWWLDRRKVEQHLIGLLHRQGYFDVWRLSAPDKPGAPAIVSKRQAYVPRWREDRGELRVARDAAERAQFYRSDCFLERLDLYWFVDESTQPSRVVHTQKGTGSFADSTFILSGEPLRYRVTEPTPEILAMEGRCAWTDEARAMRQKARQQEQQRARTGAAGGGTGGSWGRATTPLADVLAAAAHLGVTLPCTLEEVNRAHRKRAAVEHPDLTGNDAALRVTNAAAEVLRRHATAGAA